MSDTNTGAAPDPNNVTVAPSVIPLNAMSMLRLVLGVLGGWLIQHGYETDQSWNQLVGAAFIIGAAVWNLYKNHAVVKNITGALQAPAQTVINPLTSKVVPLVSPAAVKVLAMLILPTMVLVAAGSILSACSLVPTPALSTQAQIAAAKTEYTAEAAYNVIANAVLAAEPALTADQKAKVKQYMATAYQALQAARNAQSLGDTATLQTKITALQGLVKNVTAITSTVSH